MVPPTATPIPASAILTENHYRGGRGLDLEVIVELTQRYSFDKPLHECYLKMLRDYASFDFGDSLFRSASGLQLIKDSITLGIMEHFDYLPSTPFR